MLVCNYAWHYFQQHKHAHDAMASRKLMELVNELLVGAEPTGNVVGREVIIFQIYVTRLHTYHIDAPMYESKMVFFQSPIDMLFNTPIQEMSSKLLRVIWPPKKLCELASKCYKHLGITMDRGKVTERPLEALPLR